MTPLQIDILLHYYARANDYLDGDFSAPAVRQAIDDFKSENMLERATGESGATYQITERARVYIEVLLSVPLPMQRWVMPTVAPAYHVPNMMNPPGPTPHPIFGWQPNAKQEG